MSFYSVEDRSGEGRPETWTDSTLACFSIRWAAVAGRRWPTWDLGHNRAQAPRFRLVTIAASLPCLISLTGCVEPGVAALNPLPSYSKLLGKPSNVIERALADCNGRTEAREVQCVKTGLADAHFSVADLIAIVPKCRLGQMCLYGYTTRDQLGFIKAYAADLTIHWQVSFDLRRGGTAAAEVPISVAEVGL